MTANISPNSEFVICVLKPDARNNLHIIIHPVLIVRNSNPDAYVSPESVISRFKLIGSFQNRKMTSISKHQVSDENWNLLIEGLADSEIRNAGIEIDAEALCMEFS